MGQAKKSKAMAITSFIFGLTFFIPLINLIFGLLAIYLGIKSLIRIKSHPDKYSGKVYAITGLILGAIVYIAYTTGLGICLFVSKEICRIIGLNFLS